jgi:hypothetical protein
LLKNVKYEMANMDRERFHYKTVNNGSEQIYVVTPYKLLEPIEDKTGVMEKFVNHFAAPRQFT